MIKPLQFILKKRTTKLGGIRTRADTERIWRREWKALTLDDIRKFIERIPIHIRKVIELKGGNEYIEGTDKDRVIKRRGGRKDIRLMADRILAKIDDDNEEDFEDIENSDDDEDDDLGREGLIELLGGQFSVNIS